MAKKNHFTVMIVGLGGQGALFIGRLLAEAAMSKYKNVSYLPNYGGQMRMGPCECTIVISDDELGAPMTLSPEVVVMMGAAPLQRFEETMAPGSTMLTDSSLVKTAVRRKDLKVVPVPATQAAIQLGAQAVSNLVLLGAYLEISKVLPVETVEGAIEARMAASRGRMRLELLELNKAALREGVRLATESQAKEKEKVSVG